MKAVSRPVRPAPPTGRRGPAISRPIRSPGHRRPRRKGRRLPPTPSARYGCRSVKRAQVGDQAGLRGGIQIFNLRVPGGQRRVVAAVAQRQGQGAEALRIGVERHGQHQQGRAEGDDDQRQGRQVARGGPVPAIGRMVLATQRQSGRRREHNDPRRIAQSGRPADQRGEQPGQVYDSGQGCYCPQANAQPTRWHCGSSKSPQADQHAGQQQVSGEVHQRPPRVRGDGAARRQAGGWDGRGCPPRSQRAGCCVDASAPITLPTDPLEHQRVHANKDAIFNDYRAVRAVSGRARRVARSSGWRSRCR